MEKEEYGFIVPTFGGFNIKDMNPSNPYRCYYVKGYSTMHHVIKKFTRSNWGNPMTGKMAKTRMGYIRELIEDLIDQPYRVESLHNLGFDFDRSQVGVDSARCQFDPA